MVTNHRGSNQPIIPKKGDFGIFIITYRNARVNKKFQLNRAAEKCAFSIAHPNLRITAENQMRFL